MAGWLRTGSDCHRGNYTGADMDGMASAVSYAANVCEILTFLSLLPGAWIAALRHIREYRRGVYRPRHSRVGHHAHRQLTAGADHPARDVP